MPFKSTKRSMTYTGCWTCRERKVKCDERPSECRNCTRLSLVCGGYSVKLQWITDPFSDANKSSPNAKRTAHGRRMRVGVESGPSYDIAQIDRFLAAIDDCVIDGLGLAQMGPFAVFHGTSKEVLAQDSPHHLTSPEEFQEDEEENICFSKSNGIDSGSSTQLSLYEETVVQTENDPLDYQLIDPSLMRSISSSILGDSARDALMNHYIVNIASLLQPIQHPHNPYRNLYVPAALQAAPCFASSAEIPPESVQSVLLHSLLASASFHIWNCNMENATYHEIGMQHRHKAISQLQSVLSSSVPGTEYKTLMMTILSLVTIDFMSGCEADFAIHLQAADKLRASRHQWSIMSGASRQLNEISSFLSLLARTLSFPIISTPWTPGTLENEERSNIAMVKPHNCFPYMYGTTSTIASAIQRSCQLSEYLSYYRNVDTESDIPESLLEACESLGDTLLCWTLASETLPTSITEDPDNLATFNNHATAWHLAALIYYYRCIQSLPSSHYREKVRKVAEKMHALEDLKESPSSRALPNSEESSSPFTMAPITWPAFIASCEAMESDRDIWRSWWDRVQCYRIANTGQQWDAVKRIWEERDRIEKHTGLGIGSSDWREIYRGWKISLLPI